MKAPMFPKVFALLVAAMALVLAACMYLAHGIQHPDEPVFLRGYFVGMGVAAQVFLSHYVTRAWRGGK